MNVLTWGKQRWSAATVAASVLAIAVVSIFRAPPVVQRLPEAPAGGVALTTVARDKSVLSDETLLRDLAPLFLPTERNASLRRLPVREPGGAFLDDERPKLGVSDAGWRFDRDLPPVVTLNGRPLAGASALDDLPTGLPEAAAMGMGRRPRPVPFLAPRGGVVEIVALRDGERQLSEPLAPEARPPTDKLWQPLEFLASVGPAGLVAPLTLTARSGVEEVDVFYRNYLARTFRVGERLAPGFYRITVAP